jgi:hypothetical protein
MTVTLILPFSPVKYCTLLQAFAVLFLALATVLKQGTV